MWSVSRDKGRSVRVSFVRQLGGFVVRRWADDGNGPQLERLPKHGLAHLGGRPDTLVTWLKVQRPVVESKVYRAFADVLDEHTATFGHVRG